jgi:hypothetical protein
VKIEKGRPIPRNYPFDKMEVGDSFLIPEYMRHESVYMAAMRDRKKTGKKFAVRRTADGYCCWRLE